MNMENDKSSLLDSLKIERAPVRRRGTPPWVYGAAVLALLAAGAGAWFLWPDNAVPVHVVTASQEGAGGGGTSLDASGYVVARRKATLSAKIMGKIAEVNFEEGQRVKAGEVVARLDDTNYNAAPATGAAQLSPGQGGRSKCHADLHPLSGPEGPRRDFHRHGREPAHPL
jgi:multidrug efflux pump subunit AcrA (membrane-fusion protein)